MILCAGTHLYGVEPESFRPGGDEVTVGDVAGIGRVGLCVCFDGDFPETARALRTAGADLVLHPSAYEAAAERWWDTIYPAQALCNGQWWISANQHGGALADLAVEDELSAAAAAGAMLWPSAAGAPTLSPPPRTEESP